MNSTPSPPDAGSNAPAVTLPVNGDTASAQALHALLVAQIDGEGPLQIDAAPVEHIGQAVLQLVVATCGEARAAGRTVEILNPSPAFCERIERCGLNDMIGFEPSGADA